MYALPASRPPGRAWILLVVALSGCTLVVAPVTRESLPGTPPRAEASPQASASAEASASSRELEAPSGRIMLEASVSVTSLTGRGALPGLCGVAIAGSGGLYLANGLASIRRWSPGGELTDVSLYGPGSISLSGAHVQGVGVDAGGRLYAFEELYGTIRLKRAQDENVHYAFEAPTGLAFDEAGAAYVADSGHHQIFRVTWGSASPGIFAGSGLAGRAEGTGVAARFREPSGLAFDAQGQLYVADAGNHCIRRITPAGLVSTLAGGLQAGYQDGDAASASFNHPTDLAFDGVGNLYVADEGNHAIRRLDAQGRVRTVAGLGLAGYRDGSGAEAMFSAPNHLVVEPTGEVDVVDAQNGVLRQIRWR